MSGILRNTELRLDEGGAILGVLAAAVVGGFLLSTEALIALAWPARGCAAAGQGGCAPTVNGLLAFIAVLTIASGFAAFIYGLGLAILAGPLWWLLHRSGFRGWLTAVLLGAGLNLIVGLAVATCSSGIVACLTGTGAVVGWVVWKVAYRMPSSTTPGMARVILPTADEAGK